MVIKNIKKLLASTRFSGKIFIRRVVTKDQFSPIHLWEDEECFQKLMKEIIGFTLVDKVRCFMIYQYAKQAISIPGDVAEVGVYKGGTARLLARIFENYRKDVHLFDTFSGMPRSNPILDFHKKGDFADTSLDEVKLYLQDCSNVYFYAGIFPSTTSSIRDKTFCLVHIDADIYKSVMESCKFFYPRLERGA